MTIKDRKAALTYEYALDLKVILDQVNFSDNNETESVEFSSSDYSQKRQSKEMSEGLKPELFQEFVKELTGCSYIFKV